MTLRQNGSRSGKRSSGTFQITLGIALTALLTPGVTSEAHKQKVGLSKAGLSSEKLDSPEVKPVGIVGFSFRYFGGAYPQVNDILAEGPASGLDIKPGDEILAVDDHDISLNTVHETRLALMGEPGSQVKVKFRRGTVESTMTINRLSSSKLTNDHLRRAVEHYYLRSHDEVGIPFALAHLAEPGPAVVEFYNGKESTLLGEKEKQGLNVRHVALGLDSDPQSTLSAALKERLKEKLKIQGKGKNFYYFTGIASDQGFYELRPLNKARLAADLEKIHWTHCDNPAMEHFEKLREKSWSPVQNTTLGYKENERLLREVNGTATRFLKLWSQNNNGYGSDMEEILDGEAQQGLPPLGKLSLNSLLLVSPEFAVARFNSSSPCPQDIYCYLKHEKSWKITAFRALSCTASLKALRDELAAKKESNQLAQSEQNLLEHLDLTLSTDSQIRSWFFQNEQLLGDLADKAQKLKDDEFVGAEATTAIMKRPAADLKTLLQSLRLDSIGKLHNDNLEVMIGGVGDNKVGLLYSPNDKPPTISPNEYIWVERIKGHWYLFRIT